MAWAPIASGLVAHWKHNETSGSTLADSSTNSNDGTIVGTPTLGVTTLLVGGDGAITFDGSNDRVDIPLHASVNNASAHTVEAWAYWSSTPGTQETIVCEGHSGGGDTIQFCLGFDYNGLTGKIVFGFYNGSAWQLASANTPSNSTLHHIVGKWDGTELALWVDDVEVATFTPSGTSPSALTDDLHIGVNVNIDSGATNHYFAGTIEEVALYDRALSDAEISSQYSAGTSTDIHWSINLVEEMATVDWSINLAHQENVDWLLNIIETAAVDWSLNLIETHSIAWSINLVETRPVDWSLSLLHTEPYTIDWSINLVHDELTTDIVDWSINLVQPEFIDWSLVLVEDVLKDTALDWALNLKHDELSYTPNDWCINLVHTELNPVVETYNSGGSSTPDVIVTIP